MAYPLTKKYVLWFWGEQAGLPGCKLGMQTEHVKTWLADIWPEEKVAQENPGRIADAEERSLGRK